MLLSTETQSKFEQLLIESKLVSKERLEQLKLDALKAGKSVVAQIVQQKLINNENLVKLIAKANNVPYAQLQNHQVEPKVLELIPKTLAATYRVVPIGEMQGRVAVGMIDPLNLQAIDFISRKIGSSIIPYMVSEDSVNAVLQQYNVSQEVSDVINTVSQLGDDKEITIAQTNQNKKVQTLVQDAPITRALKTIIDYAVHMKASDIHIEPRVSEVIVRFRVDGILHEVMKLPKAVEPALISRVKILSDPKIDEHRRPQDGEFRLASEGKEIDFRIAIAPLTYGEQVVIRILDKDDSLLSLDKLGFKGRAFRLITEGIHKPHGMTLATGPTGSGKSTSLYTIIGTIKSPEINIVTLEDPVEYKMDGINQIQVNNEVGLTFASGLRSILRQDPDVVMVGEIRDAETADLAVQAALTGHTVLSTLHTNSAAGVLPRLLDMKIEPFLVASTVNTVIGQRLVRRICEKCKQSYQSNETESLSIKKTLEGVLPATTSEVAKVSEDLGFAMLPPLNQGSFTLYKGEGCRECTNGYKGRMGIYEVFAMTPEMEKTLAARATSSQIQAQAQKDGMLTMKQDGYLKVLNGITTLEEVARVASDY